MLFYFIIFIISISLFVVTQYLIIKQEYDIDENYNKQQKIEHFNNLRSFNINSSVDSKLLKYHNIIIQFKNAIDVNKLITAQTPTILQYINNMNQPNLLARGFACRDDLYNKYINACDDINNDERNTIQNFILELLDKIKPRNIYYYNYMCQWITKIAIAKAKPFLEDGMPHTLENTIIMDADWFINPRESTFIHELTHVHQRLLSFEYVNIYKYLGYKEYTQGVEKIKGMSSVIALNRNNPDGLSNNWLWYDKKTNTYWWIGAVFASITPSSLNDVSNIALELKLDYDDGGNNKLSDKDDKDDKDDITNKTFYYLQQQPLLLNSFTNFNNYFGNNPNNYHPNEMTAKFSEWYLQYILSNTQQNYEKYNGFTIYKEYFDDLIKTFYRTQSL